MTVRLIWRTFIGNSGNEYLIGANVTSSQRYFEAYQRTNGGWETTEQKAAARDCGVADEMTPSGKVQNTHWYMEKLFPDLYPQPRRSVAAA
jgi:hypothetical protein